MIVSRGCYCALLLLFVIFGNVSTQDNSVDVQQDIQSQLRENSGYCKCEGYNCGCCRRIVVKWLKIDIEGCINVSYLPDDVAISMAMIYNSKTIVEKTISVENLPPFCIEQSFLKILKGALCSHLYNFRVEEGVVHGCVMIEVKVFGKIPLMTDLGCFKIGNTKMTENDERNSWMATTSARTAIENQASTVVNNTFMIMFAITFFSCLMITMIWYEHTI